MKFSIGDKIILKRTGEEGIVAAYINAQMLEVEVNGTTFPVYMDEVDHPYLKWFTEQKKQKKTSKTPPEQLPVEKIKNREKRLPKGIYLSFIPVFKIGETEDIVDYLKVHLLNEMADDVLFHYDVRVKKNSYFSHEGKLHAFGNLYLHNIAFEDMNLMARCNSLAFYELLGDAALFNSDREKYFAVTANDILEYSRTILDVNNSNTLCYYSEN